MLQSAGGNIHLDIFEHLSKRVKIMGFHSTILILNLPSQQTQFLAPLAFWEPRTDWNRGLDLTESGGQEASPKETTMAGQDGRGLEEASTTRTQ